MTRERENGNTKELFKDLCSRLPYGVKVESVFINPDTKEHKSCGIEVFDATSILMIRDGLGEFKPYLFPLSSMTEEQKREYNFLKHKVPVCHYEYGDVVEEIELYDSPESFEYLIENHFDCRDLIPKGLAIDATGKNVY